MSECSHDCSTCKENCEKREIVKEKQNELSKIKKVIGVVSGKGGVGKSLVTGMLSVCANKKGYKTAVMDADITGPTMARLFGLNTRAEGDAEGKYIYPVTSQNGIKVMSLNLLLDNTTDPVIWRGPVIAGVVKQFWSDVVWGDVDYMFVDMPPGTGDVPLTVFQSLPLDGIVVVTSPQDLVSMIVGKAIKMANLMNVPVLGVVENMSYYECPKCKEKINVFGESNLSEFAKTYGIKNTVKLPINPEFAKLSDSGKIEDCNTEYIEKLFNVL